MNTAAKLSAYGLALLLMAGGGWLVGGAVGPFSGEGAESHAAPEAPGTDANPGDPPGLALSSGGYLLVPDSTVLERATPNRFDFRILGPDGAPVTDFDVEHEKRMHLIVVRRDTADFQHVHPEMAADGTWTVPLTLPEAGSYRAFADFKPAGAAPATLGADLSVPGEYEPVTHRPSRMSTVDDYEVRVDGDLVPAEESKVTLTVGKDGEPVTDLQPYLGAYGHLVALREGDLAYLHVHPDGEPGDGVTEPGPEVTFYVEVPSAGSYRLFLDFQHGDTVRTAKFTLTAADAGPAADKETAPSDEDDHAGHGG